MALKKIILFAEVTELEFIFWKPAQVKEQAKLFMIDQALRLLLLKKMNLIGMKYLRDTKWFHWTGITPALGKDAQETLKVCL